jgi:hypothetical protein
MSGHSAVSERSTHTKAERCKAACTAVVCRSRIQACTGRVRAGHLYKVMCTGRVCRGRVCIGRVYKATGMYGPRGVQAVVYRRVEDECVEDECVEDECVEDECVEDECVEDECVEDECV